MDIRKFAKAPTDAESTTGKGFVNTQVPSRPGGEQTPITTGDADDGATERPDDELGEDLVKEYLKFLEEHDISKEDIFAVLDSLVTHGTIQWNWQLLGRVLVAFQVRPAWVNTLVLERIQKNPPTTYAAFNDMVNTCNLAGSLIAYADRQFAVTDERTFDLSRDFVQQLPFAIKSRLTRELAVFDRVVAVATSDWAVENFQKPSSAE